MRRVRMAAASSTASQRHRSRSMDPPRVRWRWYTLAVISSSHPEEPMTLRRLIAGLTALAALALVGPATAETTLRVVMHSDLKIVDPIWTTAYIVRNHGYMIYDTLFAMDAKGEIRPQMVDKYEVSKDQLTYTITPCPSSGTSPRSELTRP